MLLIFSLCSTFKNMISLKRLVTQKVFRHTCLSLIFTKESHGLRFHQIRDFMICNKKSLQFFSPKLISSMYSTNVNRGSKEKPAEKCAPEVEKSAQQALEEIEEEIMEEDDCDDDGNDEYDDYNDDDGDEEGLEDSNRQKMFEKIANGDPEILNKLKLLEFEVALFKEMGVKLPEVIKKQHWEELLHLSSNFKKTEYLEFLYINDLKKKNERDSKKLKREKAFEIVSKSGFHYYGLAGHTLFYRVYSNSVKRLLNHRQYGSELKILFDCSYQEYMSPRGIRNCARQLAMTFSNARFHKVSCELGLCNLDRNDQLGKILPSYLDDSFYNLEKSQKSYLDLYQREKLIYLSPHASSDLTEINKDNVYIIGSYVDKGYGIKASLAKSKENNVRAAKFPIDFYLAWKEGSKALTFPIVVNILLDMAYYKDWYRAFKNIPSKCHYGGQQRRKISPSKADNLILNLEN